MATTTSNTLIKLPTVKSLTSLSTSEIYRRIEAGTFPAQIKLGVKAVAWLEHEVNDWISRAIEQGRTGSGAA
ncbi:MAG: AlpA family phage regulatory protein [Gammaproteobacteria bacterium]|nr:AlpA family phage regulatory protein [Gammaproteobacteria bacterium]MBQ0773454.1 AlpA family phage regulatory protein [Gammaproteobacteria bacterium]